MLMRLKWKISRGSRRKSFNFKSGSTLVAFLITCRKWPTREINPAPSQRIRRSFLAFANQFSRFPLLRIVRNYFLNFSRVGLKTDEGSGQSFLGERFLWDVRSRNVS